MEESVMPYVEREELIKLVESASWRKTVKYPPHLEHEYIVLTKETFKTFVKIQEAVRKYGRLESYYELKYKYLYLDGYRYWVIMKVCNRETVEKYVERQKLIAAGEKDAMTRFNGHKQEVVKELKDGKLVTVIKDK
jgi:hypothetical protein